MENELLNKRFVHSTFFKGSKMSKRDFLDYVIAHVKDWWLKGAVNYDAPMSGYKYFYLTRAGSRARYRLSNAECEYLAQHHSYFLSALQEGGFKMHS